MRARVGAAGAALLLSTLAPRVLQAQLADAVGPVAAGGTPRWTEAWSPLVPLGELPRTLPGVELGFADLLILSAPRIGLFWTAGNPAALPREVGELRTEFQVGSVDHSGDFRRPFDPGDETHQVVAGRVWGPLGSKGAGIGRVVVDHGSFKNQAFSDLLVPYSTEPFTVIDTLGEETSRTAVQLEGAGGWQLGRLGLGLGFGYAQQETRTVESAVPVLNRTANPGVTGGVTYDLAGGKVHIGTYGRWQQTAETVSILSVAAASRVYRFGGFNDPTPINLVATFFSQRFNHKAWAAGATVGAELGAVSWTAFAQREDLTSENFNTTFGEGMADNWDADGWTAGAAAQADLAAHHLLVTVDARYSNITGEEKRAEIDGTPFTTDETRWHVNGELRGKSDNGWEAALGLGIKREDRRRSDGLAEAATDIRAWRPAAALEVAHWLSATVALSGGVAVSEYNPSGSVPLAATLGPVYQNWLAPAVALEVTEATAHAFMGTLRWQARAALGFWVQVRSESASPPDNRSGLLPGAPRGDRDRLRAAFGVVLGGR